MMKRFLSILLSLCLLASCAVSFAEAPETHQLEKKTVPLYVEDDGKIWDEVPLWLVDGVDDLPYMDLMTLPDFLNPVWSLLWEDETPVQRYTGTYDPALRQYHLLYEPTEASIIFSLDTNTLFFADYDRLNSAADSQPLDMLSFTGFTDEGLPETYARVSRSQFIRPES